MFAVNYFIDTIQSSKKYFVNSFITDKEIREPLHAFIDTQTTFVKQLVKTNQEVMDQVLESFTKHFNPTKV